MPQFVYLADRNRTAFEAAREAVDVVCAGDSITGWNNFGPAGAWPYRTYPEFLQTLCDPHGLTVANIGIAGEVSANGPGQVCEGLGLFPNARVVVIGYGTNDLGMWPDVERTSPRIVANVDLMVRAVRDAGRRPLLVNVPQANEAMFAPRVARDLRRGRDVHNAALAAYCEEHEVPLADIAARLRDEHLGDELHPNDDGAAVIAGAVYESLARLLPTSP